MTDKSDSPGPDVQSLPDKALMLYEAIATLEFSGQRPSFRNIASATSIAPSSLQEELADMTRRGLIRIADEASGDGPVYVPSQRGWSTAPEQAEGHKMSS
jgi:hypothetical protein